jgi:hypothetical protein
MQYQRGVCKTTFEPERLMPRTAITGGPMRQKRFGILIAGIMLAAIMLHADIACAQDNATSTVRGKMYVCYFYTQNGAQNYEITFSPAAYVSIMDGKGFGLYLTAGSLFAGYYLELNQFLWGDMRTVIASDDWLDTHDILMFFTGAATGATIQGTGFTWIDFKNRQPFIFVGYQHVTE